MGESKSVKISPQRSQIGGMGEVDGTVDAAAVEDADVGRCDGLARELEAVLIMVRRVVGMDVELPTELPVLYCRVVLGAGSVYIFDLVPHAIAQTRSSRETYSKSVPRLVCKSHC